MQSSIKSQVRPASQSTGIRLLMSTVVPVFCCLLFLSGCTVSASRGVIALSSPIVGGLVELGDTPVFTNKTLSVRLESPSSHAVTISSLAPYSFMLTDGRVAWSKHPLRGKPLAVTIASKDANFSSLPQEGVGTPGFEWLEHTPEDSFSILGFSAGRYQETPYFIQQQGRRLANQSTYQWPQVHVGNKNVEGWVSAQYLSFSLSGSELMTTSGLKQEPFLLLNNKRSHFESPTLMYQEFSHKKAVSIPLMEASWTIRQEINPESTVSTDIESIVLASSEDNCNMIFVQWNTLAKSAFGYCSEAQAGPTPLIHSYRFLPSEEGMVLTLLEITGDNSRQVQYYVPNRHMPKNTIRLIE